MQKEQGRYGRDLGTQGTTCLWVLYVSRPPPFIYLKLWTREVGNPETPIATAKRNLNKSLLLIPKGSEM